MYPNEDGTPPYVRKAWYIAGWAEEISEVPLGRTIMDEPIVFYRTDEGKAVAMWGACAHRNYPLEKGRVSGDTIICPYHGFTYNSEGACVRIPGQKGSPGQFRAKTYPLVEDRGILWIWMGDPSLASAHDLPGFRDFGLSAPGWRSVPNGLTYIKCRWQLLIDNLMDLTHINHLHASTLPSDENSLVPIYSGGNRYVTSRWLVDQSPDIAYHRNAFRERNELWDGRMDSVFLGPSLIVTNLVFFTPASAGDRQYLGTTNHFHGITPESPNTVHDFSLFVRDFLIGEDSYDIFERDVAVRARDEDRHALELVEPLCHRFGDARHELSGVNDRAALHARHHISQLLQAEADGESPT